jgi:hypothetical protein
MKVPIFCGATLAEFLKSAQMAGVHELKDGSKLNVWAMVVDAPEFCLQEDCQLEKRLRRNGSYMRLVFEGLRLLIVLIYRFRCGLCGRTVSRPYSFLVPYRRFTAKLICQGIEMYAGAEETSYREVSTELSVFEPELDSESEPAPAPQEATGKEGFCPARSTVFSWVDRFCKRTAMLLQQIEKELVLRNIDLNHWPIERQFRNQNSWKAGLGRYKHQKDKPVQLNKLSYWLALAKRLLGAGQTMENLRTYFLRSAEKCVELLSDVSLVLPITHTSEQPAW